jgi:hypothetical protein
MTTADDITQQVRALANLDLEGLRAEWRKRYGPPPKMRSPDMLARLLAWRIQAAWFGGIDAETKALIFRKSMPTPGPSLTPGMRLEREWRGRKEVVEVVQNGFRWKDQTYPSLSKVAGAITGGKWNGPRFFGLRDKAAA